MIIIPRSTMLVAAAPLRGTSLLIGYAARPLSTARDQLGFVSRLLAFKPRPADTGCLVALADMPFVAPATISLLAYALRGAASLAAPFFEGQRGHPVAFASRWQEELAAPDGDHGARDMLSIHASELLQVPCNDPGILADIDTPAAFVSCLLHTPSPVAPR